GILEAMMREAVGVVTKAKWQARSHLPAETSHMPQHITDGKEADGPAVLDHWHVPIAADIHFMQRESKGVLGSYCLRIGGHEVPDREFRIIVYQPRDLHEEIAFAKNAGQFALLIDHKNGPNVEIKHRLDRHIDGRSG